MNTTEAQHTKQPPWCSRMRRRPYILWVIGVLITANALNLVLWPIYSYNPPCSYWVIALLASCVFCSLSLKRSADAQCTRIIAVLQLLFFVFPPVWLGMIYLMCIPSKPAAEAMDTT